MSKQYVKITQEDAIATVTLNNPPRNVLSIELISELENVARELAEDTSLKVIVLNGSGPLFVAGADIKVIAGITSAKEGEAMARQGQTIFDQFEQMNKVVIAAINGYCLGGGMELAMACHVRIAGDRTRFGQPEINLGIMPGFGGTQRLPRLVGEAKAIELILTGDMVNAEEAKRIGLVNRVVPEGEVLKQAMGLAKKIASKGKKAIEASLKAIMEGMNEPLSMGLRREAQLFGEICETFDKKEGVSAFLEKRQPKFQNR